MNFNGLFIPCLGISIGLFFVSQRIWQKLLSVRVKGLFFLLCLLAAGPGALMIVYYFHILDKLAWFYQFRSIPYTELLLAGIGLPAGILASVGGKARLVSRPFIFTLMLIAVSIPFLKPILTPLDYTVLEEKFNGEIALQSSCATCGPACAVTLLRHFGIAATERAIAMECHTYVGGTEIWYIARALRKRGLVCEFVICDRQQEAVPYPAIAGIDMGTGHFITILDKVEGMYHVGDPLVGRQDIEADRIYEKLPLTGFFLVASGHGE